MPENYLEKAAFSSQLGIRAVDCTFVREPLHTQSTKSYTKPVRAPTRSFGRMFSKITRTDLQSKVARRDYVMSTIRNVIQLNYSFSSDPIQSWTQMSLLDHRFWPFCSYICTFEVPKWVLRTDGLTDGRTNGRTNTHTWFCLGSLHNMPFGQ